MSAGEFAGRRDARAARGPAELDQVARQHRRIHAHRDQLRHRRDSLAVPLGCGALTRLSARTRMWRIVRLTTVVVEYRKSSSNWRMGSGSRGSGGRFVTWNVLLVAGASLHWPGLRNGAGASARGAFRVDGEGRDSGHAGRALRRRRGHDRAYPARPRRRCAASRSCSRTRATRDRCRRRFSWRSPAAATTARTPRGCSTGGRRRGPGPSSSSSPASAPAR